MYVIINLLLEKYMDDVKEENSADSTLDLPQVININNGILLPEVDIREKRAFVDYATFRDFDIHKDREGYNKMNITLREYLKSQGYIIHEHDNELNMLIIGPDTPGGSFTHPFNIKMSSIKSVVLFDEPMEFETCCRIITRFNGGNIDIKNHYELNENEKSKLNFVFPKELKYLYIITLESSTSDTYNLKNIEQHRLPLHGYTQPAQFYSPQYPDGPQYYDVDYRRTLYWNPNLETDKDGHAGIEFYNNSYSTRFKVSSSGLNGGVPYSMDK